MATTGTEQRRRLPKLNAPNPPASSDETPREESARRRRRVQQELARQQSPSGRESVTSPPVKDLPLPPRSYETDERQTTKRRKARRRVRSSSQLQQEPSLLQGFEDEVIIESSKKKFNEPILPDLLLSNNQAGNAPSQSAPTPRIYFENKKTFSSVNKDAAPVRLGTTPGKSPFAVGYDPNFTIQQQTAEVLKRYTVHVAKQTHNALQKFFLFLHGINSGYALWVCVFAFVFTRDDNVLSFFTIYRSIALITHVLFYIFIALCMVDILDRVDPVKFNTTVLVQSITAQNSAIAFLFYAVAMVVNLVMMQTEDHLRVSQYVNVTNKTYLSVEDVAYNQSSNWKNLTAVRAAFIVAGWIIVSIHVKNDRLNTMIKNTEEKAFYEELNIEQNTVPLVTGITSP